jgi:cell division initiation protein
MALSAIDIEQKTFRVALRGYAEEEVDAFLDEVISTVRSFEDQIKESRDRIAQLESRVSENRDTEDRITKTLVIAQKTADEVVREARYEAQQILSQARLDASAAESEQADRRERLRSEVETLQSAVSELRNHVKGLGDGLLRQIDETQSAMGGAVPSDLVSGAEETPAYQTGETPAYQTGETPAYQTGETPAYQQEEGPSDASAEGYAGTHEDEVEDEDPDYEEPQNADGEYLGSDRRPWERYGD